VSESISAFTPVLQKLPLWAAFHCCSSSTG